MKNNIKKEKSLKNLHIKFFENFNMFFTFFLTFNFDLFLFK